ncbi:MAG: hypothetical protein LBQ56_04155 [Synergistaceae bacterium]|jgi:segregation and condensation protein A|nr:hypothetical protein [Synergistaceae bacterium]
MPDDPAFNVTLGEFSGPLDLLCALVEKQEMDASSLRLTDVLSQYVEFLLTTKRATLMELADFFSLASRLLVRKVRSLLPRVDVSGDPDGAPGADCADGLLGPDGETDELRLEEMLERFKPYRSAAAYLAGMKERRDRCLVRISDEGGPPWFDMGDLYGLSTLWWSLIDEHSRRRSAGSGQAFIMEIPDAAPEEVLVEARMGEIEKIMEELRRVNLSGLLMSFGDGGLIVTLLALLELSRLGKLALSQPETWGDVEVAAAGA